MSWNFNKDQVKELGWMGLKLLGKIGIEGTKVVALNVVTSTFKTGMNEGIEGIKTLEFDDYLNGGRKKKSAFKLFGKKKPAVVLEAAAEEVEELEELEEEWGEVEEILDYEIIEPEPVKNPNF